MKPKLRSLESEKAALAIAIPTEEPIIFGADKVWKRVVGDLENLKDVTKPDEIENARRLIRQIVGEVEIREEAEGTFAYAALNTPTGYKDGAEERT